MNSPLIFLHGALSTGSSFKKIQAALGDSCTHYAPDFPGHGKGPVGGNISTDNLCEYVLGWMQDRKIEKASIFGHSLGGYIGLALAANYPDKVERVFTFGTKMSWTPQFASRETQGLDPLKMEQENSRLADYLAASHYDWKKLTRNVASYMTDLGRSPSLDNSDLSKIHCPVRMSVGDRDHMVSVDETWSSYKAIQKGQLQVFPQTGHAVEKLSPELFLEAWFNFIKS